MDTKQLFVAATEALFHSHDAQARRQADAWLKEHQQQPEAWEVAECVLQHHEGVKPEAVYLAAQTLRTKVQFDFLQLEDHDNLPLFHRLIALAARFQSTAQICTQLALAVADLSIQMLLDSPVATLIQAFEGRPAKEHAVLLAILQGLPEENMNPKVLTDADRRFFGRERLRAEASEVFVLLERLQAEASNDSQLHRKLFRCFLAWLRFATPSAAQLKLSLALRPELFTLLASRDPELGESAADIIVEVLRLCGDEPEAFDSVVAEMVPRILNLQQAFASAAHRGDVEALRRYVRIFTEAGESFVCLIVEQNDKEEMIALLQLVCLCTQLPIHELALIPLNFWHDLASIILCQPERDRKLNEFRGVFVQVLHGALRGAELPVGEDPFAVDEEWKHYRSHLLVLADDCAQVLSANTALDEVLKSLVATKERGILAQEAHLFLLTSVASRAECREDSQLWQLLTLLPELIVRNDEGDGIDVRRVRFAGGTAVALLGCLGNWLPKKPVVVFQMLELVSAILLNPEAPSFLHGAASSAFMEICFGCRLLLGDAMGNLCNLYVRTLETLPIRHDLYVVEGVAFVCNWLPDDKFGTYFGQLCEPLVRVVADEAMSSVEVLVDIFDRFTCILRMIRIVREESPRGEAVGALLADVLWPLLEARLTRHAGEARVAEKGCRVLKHAMRCLPQRFASLVGSVAAVVERNFVAFGHSPYLYSADILVHTYGQEAQLHPVLSQLFRNLSAAALDWLDRARGAETVMVDELFSMCERYLRYAPQIVLEAPCVPRLLDFTTKAIRCEHRESVEAAMAFLERMYETMVHHETLGPGLRPFLLELSPRLVATAFDLLVNVPLPFVLENIPSLFFMEMAAFPAEFPLWVDAGLCGLPKSMISPAEHGSISCQLLPTPCNENAFDTIEKVVRDLAYRCEQVAMRRRNELAQPKAA